MERAKILTILKRTVSVILGLLSAFALFYIFIHVARWHTITAADIRLLLILVIPLVSLVSFSILWNIIKQKRVYALLLVPLLGIGAFILNGVIETQIRRARWEAVQASRAAEQAQRAQEVERVRQEAERARAEAERVRIEAEQQAKIELMDTVLYTNGFPELTLWAAPTGGWANRRAVGTVPYRTEVSLSRDQDAMVNSSWGGGLMVFVAREDVRGWVFYSQLTETIESESLLGYWEEEGTGDVWRFESDGNFAIRWGRWGSARGTYERVGDNRIIFTFARHGGLEGLLGIHFESSFRRRFSMEAELFVVDEDKRILRLSNRVVSIW